MPHPNLPAIRILPERIVNRIAAGEVIERPAAAVKELVENALDAGASRIAVALDGGGIDRIEVTDDGVRHGRGRRWRWRCSATPPRSWPTTTWCASPPWASAARRCPRSARRRGWPSPRARPGPTARRRSASRAASVSPVAPSAGAPGTRVVVRDLFFATPARRKFLKHPRTEAEHAEAAVRRLALAAPGVAFRLESDGRAVFDLPRQDRAARVAALLGPDAAAALLPVAGERGALRIDGFRRLAGGDARHRGGAGADGERPAGRRPGAEDRGARGLSRRDRRRAASRWWRCISTLPPEELDVNVHPAKAELRFRDAGAVRALVIGALGRALGTTLGGAGTDVPAPRPALHLVHSRPHAHRCRARRAAARVRPRGRARVLGEAQLPLAAAPAARFWPAPAALPEHPLGAPVAQVLDTYVIAVASDGALVLVDQHAAHERLTHEALKDEMLAGGVRSQPLLLPAVVELPPADAARLLAQADALARLGLEIEGFGAGAVLVRALPAALGAPEPAPLLRDLADQLAEADEATALEARLDAAIARMACHGSIRAGRRLTPAEMDALLRRMEATPRAATCSHGRPTFLKLTQADIEQLFGRR